GKKSVPKSPLISEHNLLRSAPNSERATTDLPSAAARSGGVLTFLRSVVRTHDVSVPRTISGRQGAADYFIPPPSIASIAKSIAAFRCVAESVRRIDLSLSVE
ncbi:MAG: hypothetical protein WBL84_08470, partial [Xanthobacteraceae bacterium]